MAKIPEGRLTRRLRIVAYAAAALVAAPILALALTAILGGGAALQAALRAAFLPSIVDTALLLAMVAVLAGGMGLASAWLVTAYRFPFRDLLAVALVFPLALPTYLAAYVSVELLDALGPVQYGFRALFGYRDRSEYWFPEIRSLPGAALVLAFVLYPYVYLPVRALFAFRSAELSEAARILGAGSVSHFRRVVAPLARPALAAGLAFVLLEVVNDVGASEYLGVRTLTVAVFDTWLNRGSLAGASQIALFSLLAVVTILGLEAWARRDKRYSLSVRRPRLIQGARLSGWRALLAALICLVPVLIGFVAPTGFLLMEAGRAFAASGVPVELARQAANTALFAGVAAMGAVLLGAVCCLAVRLAGRGGASQAPKRIAALGYAMPGAVLALGFLTPLAWIDQLISEVSRAWFGLGRSQVLIGSGAAVVLALVARFTSLAIGTIDAGLDRVAPRIDDAARNLGAADERVLRRVLAPLLRPALASAAILVFVDAVKELPATLLLRPLGVETLATALYGHAARGRFEDGALQALAILAISLIPVARLARLLNVETGPPRPDLGATFAPTSDLSARR